jgi:hypothetical protein
MKKSLRILFLADTHLDFDFEIDLVFRGECYTSASLRKEIVKEIEELPMDSIIRFKLTHPKNLTLQRQSF